MKSLKAKNILFSLLTVLAITALTSCEQESVVIPDAEVIELTAPEHPAFVTDMEDRSCSCDVQVGNITVSNVAVASGSAPRKKFVVDTGIYTPGCTRNNFFWYTYGNSNVNVHWENNQAMSASFTAPGSYPIGAYLNATDSNGAWCYDYSYVYVTIP